MDRIAGLQDCRIGFPLAKLWVNYGQDCRIYRKDCFKLNKALTMTGLQDLQDCKNSHPVHPENPVHPVNFFKMFLCYIRN